MFRSLLPKQTLLKQINLPQSRLLTTSSLKMSSTNQYGQGKSHATDSSLPESVQRQAPKKLEDEIPDSVHDTNSNKDTGKVSHAKGDSVVPQSIQEALPESVERAVPDFIHDTTGDDGRAKKEAERNTGGPGAAGYKKQ